LSIKLNIELEEIKNPILKFVKIKYLEHHVLIMESKIPFVIKRLLIGWMPSPSLINYVKTKCIEEEIKRLPEILECWKHANSKFLSLRESENCIAESIEIKDLDSKFDYKVQEIRNDPYFKATFGSFITEFKLVEISKMIAFRGDVALDYVDKLKSFPDKLSDDIIFDTCLPMKKEHAPVSELKLSGQQYIFTSENTEFRYLGASSKEVNQDDLNYSNGGIPIKGILVLFGYSAMRVNAFLVKNKVFLSNGFHRIFALYSNGIRHVPIILQKVKNPDLAFPNPFLGVPREYALNATRPPLVKDFFDTELTIDLKVKPLRKGVKLSIISEDIDIPL
jgi:hypothetical protein